MNNRVAILLTTFLRDELLKNTVESIIKYFPENSFLFVGDQGIPTKGKDNYFKALFEESGNVFFYKLPYDCGLSFARNYLVNKASMNNIPYCLITADSIQFTDKYPFQDIIKGMVNKEDALVGLNIADRITWEWNIDLIPNKHFWLSKIPKEDIEQYKNFTIKKVSMCRNFFLAKTEALLDVKWDNALKLGEHEDFFWRFKTKGYKCTWTDYITAKYIDSKPKEYKELRDRMYHTFQYILLKKYGIVQWMKWEIENE